MLAVLVLLFLIVALAGYLIGVYNGLVRVRAAVKLAWSNIDVLLVQRHDELPKLSRSANNTCSTKPAPSSGSCAPAPESMRPAVPAA